MIEKNKFRLGFSSQIAFKIDQVIGTTKIAHFFVMEINVYEFDKKINTFGYGHKKAKFFTKKKLKIVYSKILFSNKNEHLMQKDIPIIIYLYAIYYVLKLH